jgi:Helix-turn-helix domain of resolvase
MTKNLSFVRRDYSRFNNIGNNPKRAREPHRTPLRIRTTDYTTHLTTIIAHIMGCRLLDEVVHRIRLRIDAGEKVTAIAKAVKVSKKTIYKLRLNLDIWDEPYAPPTVVLGRPRTLLLYQELVIYSVL